jgi:broad specificity phosphatase PhoE
VATDEKSLNVSLTFTTDAEDSPLNDAGRQRAQALASVAADAGVSAIYTTLFKRNHETAQPLAQRAGVTVTEMPVDLQNPGDYGQRLARDVFEKHRGQTVVVIGHGNTVAPVVEGLLGRAPQLGDVQYGDLLIVTVPPSGQAELIRAQYGAAALGRSALVDFPTVALALASALLLIRYRLNSAWLVLGGALYGPLCALSK